MEELIKMPINKIAQILENHGVNYTIKNGEIFAEDILKKGNEINIHKINLTGFSGKQLLIWLGY